MLTWKSHKGSFNIFDGPQYTIVEDMEELIAKCRRDNRRLFAEQSGELGKWSLDVDVGSEEMEFEIREELLETVTRLTKEYEKRMEKERVERKIIRYMEKRAGCFSLWGGADDDLNRWPKKADVGFEKDQDFVLLSEDDVKVLERVEVWNYLEVLQDELVKMDKREARAFYKLQDEEDRSGPRPVVRARKV